MTQHLLLEADSFQKLHSESTVEDWAQALSQTGLLQMVPDESIAGQHLKEIQQQFQSAQQQTQRARQLLQAATLALGMLALLFLVWAAQHFPGSSLCFVFVGIGPLGLWKSLQHLLAQALSRPARERLRIAVDHMLQSSFIAAMGDTIVESVPARNWLKQRQTEVASAIQAAERHKQGLITTQDRIQTLNQRMGQPAQDPETIALQTAIQGMENTQSRLRALAGELSQKRVLLEKRLEERRLRIERQMLSAQVDQLKESPALRLRAIGEEIPLIEAEIQSLDLQIKEEEQRLTAALEVRGSLN